jgi:hypothetical protein
MDLTKHRNVHKVVIIVVLLIIAVTALSVYYNGPLINNFSETDTQSRPPNNATTDKTGERQKNVNYFNTIDIDYNIPKGVSNFYTGKDELLLINNSDTVFTYNSANTINLNNIIEDILEGIAVTDELNLEGCTNTDQLAVKYQQKTCTNNRCLDRYGNKISDKQIIEEISANGDIPRCVGQELGYLTFNFIIDPITNLVSKDTLFMDVPEIYIGVSIYKEFSQDKNMEYYLRNNLFIEDPNIGISDIIPRIKHSTFSRNDYRQKIIIKRYNQGGTENTNGSLAELIFRPGQLFLDAVNVENSINSFTTTADSSYTGNYAVRSIFQGTNGTAKCIIDEKNNIQVIDGGKDYSAAQTVSIVNDLGVATGAYNINIFAFSKRLIMRSRGEFSNENRAVWLLAPPLDLSPESITKENKLTKGYIINFSDQSPVKNIKKATLGGLPTYSKVSPGTLISAIPTDPNQVTTTVFDELIVGTYNSTAQTTYYNYKTDGNGKLVGPNVRPSFYKNIKYLYSGEVTTSLFSPTTTSQNLNKQIYSKYPDFLLKAVNTYPMFANPQNFINGAIVNVSVFEKNDDTAGKVTFDSDFVTAIGFSINQDAIAPVVSDGIILDGAAEWQSVNPFEKVMAFTDEYFNNQSISEFGANAASVISNITNPVGGVSFVTPIFGKIDTIDPTTADYSDVVLPNLTGAVVVDLNSTTLNLDPDSNGVIGTGGKCILSFVSAPGASTIIQSAQITKPGSGFTSGTFGLSASFISPGVSGYIHGINISAVDDSYIYKAVTIDESSIPISGASISLNPAQAIRFGLTIDPVKNKVISLLDPTIINGGQNYKTDLKVYINQFFEDSSESIFGIVYNPEEINSTTMQKLPYVTITGVSSNVGSSVFPAPYPLVKDTSINLSYNFWEDSPGVYETSPQQLIYYGDFIGVSLPYNGDPADNIKKYFLGNKIDDSAFTDIEFLSSLQIPSFYYQDSADNVPSINSYEGLALKRFIPYRAYKPPTKNSSDIEIPTGNPTNTYVNYNYCQFVPFGIRDFYNQPISGYENAPSF